MHSFVLYCSVCSVYSRIKNQPLLLSKVIFIKILLSYCVIGFSIDYMEKCVSTGWLSNVEHKMKRIMLYVLLKNFSEMKKTT